MPLILSGALLAEQDLVIVSLVAQEKRPQGRARWLKGLWHTVKLCCSLSSLGDRMAHASLDLLGNTQTFPSRIRKSGKSLESSWLVL